MRPAFALVLLLTSCASSAPSTERSRASDAAQVQDAPPVAEQGGEGALNEEAGADAGEDGGWSADAFDPTDAVDSAEAEAGPPHVICRLGTVPGFEKDYSCPPDQGVTIGYLGQLPGDYPPTATELCPSMGPPVYACATGDTCVVSIFTSVPPDSGFVTTTQGHCL